ncbi:Serine/threonine-protein kinase PknD [Paraburkholderia domus]|jgi:Serine/threonine protein kinase|uniref:serine/threonine-protein kinase n=1 Tax=Paraburkholderia domus TaxID=2793075 RepID=UPI0019121341|nr:serine/threonine-protein kinase [Paraburkholderia domus]MBK5050796.1 serine/threonine protein kinase [Burkholderia sp. R-70006]MBK5089875.1 serine/threonine protein kinase [Burkholderia sp. R-69927]CAE6766058.1 Serine/threonine-protein kinase PknD [Paraburkholderia domus]CAE6905504.1 Serine/threonine-protein kinase PknD [Paraburkholderia domus]
MLKPHNRAELEFDLIREIGAEGRNSKVYLAHDHQLNAQLVIKSIDKAAGVDPTKYFHEASILYESSHPYVVPIHYGCFDNDAIHIAMPYYARGSIASLLNQRFLTVREVIRFGVQFLAGLHNIHSKGLIHFDIKPDNILISDRGEALLSDFGLAKRTNKDGLAAPDMAYSRMITPERARQEADFSFSHDIYQAGLTLYRMTAGNTAFDTQWNAFIDKGALDAKRFVNAVAQGTFPDRSAYPEHIPQKLRSIIKKCLECDPAIRYTSVLQITNALAEIDDQGIDWKYEEWPDGSRRWSRDADGSERSLEIAANGSSVAKKQRKDGSYAQVKAYCLKSIGKAAIKDFLRKE